MQDQLKPISLVFEDVMPPERIAEFINLLSEFYGEDIDVVSVDDIPPLTKMREAC